MKESTEVINPFKEFAELGQKIMKGFETLRNIDEVDVATAPKKAVWKRDKVTLFHYKHDSKPKVTTPVLISYALVNRQDMLDLQPDRSFIRNLLDLGLDLYIMDWGYPTRADRYLTMDDYINGYLDEAVDFVRQEHGLEKVTLMGICQGGTFSVIYSALHPEKVKNVVTLVTPIDFSTNEGLLYRWAKDMDIDAIVDGYGVVPGEFMNMGFSLLKPMMRASKYIGLLEIIDDEAKLKNFLRMEKWINDSPSQAGECYRQFLKDLYQENKLLKGTLEVGGKRVDLKKVTMPVLNIYAEEDHLVPPASSIPLNSLVGSKDTDTYVFKGGHIGVFVGSRSQKELAPAVADWLKHRD